jgi:hypothetical protein
MLDCRAIKCRSEEYRRNVVQEAGRLQDYRVQGIYL